MARYLSLKGEQQADGEKVGGVTPENLDVLRARLRGGG